MDTDALRTLKIMTRYTNKIKEKLVITETENNEALRWEIDTANEEVLLVLKNKGVGLAGWYDEESEIINEKKNHKTYTMLSNI